MRSLLALSLLIALSGAANATPAHHARRHTVVRSHQSTSGSASSFAYAPSQPPAQFGSALSGGSSEPYYGASQGYAPGEKERFLRSLYGP